MTANDVIESYVADVAVQLPRRQRNGVAFELRVLLEEELRAKAEAAGRSADASMATELAQAFGRPRDVAARYRPALTIVDPADGRNFLRAAVIGLAIIWSVGLLLRLRQPIDSGSRLLGLIGQWWGATVIPSMWWPGVLVVGFGAAAWARRRWPDSSPWLPRAGDRLPGGRGVVALGLAGVLCGAAVLSNPLWLLDVAFDGRAAPAAYEALTYTDAFRHRAAPWLLALILLNVPLLIIVTVQGRWSGAMRRIDIGLRLLTCAVMAWAVLDGPVFDTPASDRTFKFLLAVIVAITLIDIAVKLHRSIRPAPDTPMQA